MNQSVRTLLLLYDDLTPDERAVADAFLRDNPSAETVIEEGRRLQTLIAEQDETLTDEHLALVVANRVIGAPRSGSMAELDRRVTSARMENPSLDVRYRELEARLAGIEASLPDPAQHLAALTGETPDIRRRQHRDAHKRAPDRRPRASNTRIRIGALTALAVMIAIIATVILSEATTPEHVQLAALGSAHEMYEQPRLRGAEAPIPPAEAHFSWGLEALAESHRSTLGLFRRYDEPGLTRALEHFEAATAIDQESRASATRAHVMIGRIHLHRGNIERARAELELALAGEGEATLDARDLLDRLDARELHR